MTPTPTAAAPRIDQGADVGSSTISGRSRPGLPDGCIRILGGTLLDQLLGSDGSDAGGHFSIALVRSLVAGDRIRAADACAPFSEQDPLLGTVLLITAPAPAPALAPQFVLVSIIMLVILAASKLRRA
jgi:hypothetical protein